VNALCASIGAHAAIVPSLKSPKGVHVVARLRPDVIVYTGGGIVPTSLLDTAPQGILNNHSGPLPAVRGMNAVEWSVLLGQPVTATIHRMDQGIDTGPILAERPVRRQAGDTLATLRAAAVLTGLDALCDLLAMPVDGWQRRENPANEGRQYYTMSSALRRIVEDRVARWTPEA
jgi:methionyl-tRNA formyltransferase